MTWGMSPNRDSPTTLCALLAWRTDTTLWAQVVSTGLLISDRLVGLGQSTQQ